MKDFLQNPSARLLGTILTLACLFAAVIARFFWDNIDLTQIIMMILAPATNMISYGMGAAHVGRTQNNETKTGGGNNANGTTGTTGTE